MVEAPIIHPTLSRKVPSPLELAMELKSVALITVILTQVVQVTCKQVREPEARILQLTKSIQMKSISNYTMSQKERKDGRMLPSMSIILTLKIE